MDPGDILVDSSADNIHSLPIHISSGDEQDCSSDKKNIHVSPRSDFKDICSGKKGFQPLRTTTLKNDFQDCTKQLLHIIDDVEKERNHTQRDMMEITRSEFETNVKLQKERIVAAQQSSEALWRLQML